MLKLWGRNNSVNVQKAIWCLEELKLPNVEAWFKRLSQRAAFKKNVLLPLN